MPANSAKVFTLLKSSILAFKLHIKCAQFEFMRILSIFMAFSVVFWLFSSRYGLYTVFKGSNYAKYLTMMYYHHFASINLKFAKIGTFWPFLATFGIESVTR